MARATKRPTVTICSTQHALRVPRRLIDELVAFVARAESARIAEVDVAVVDARQMAAMNRRYLRHAGATDVLSFDLSEAGVAALSVQLIVCGDVAVAAAAERHLRPQHELLLYVIHGLLHLLGYDDGAGPAARRMHAREQALLAEFLRLRRRAGRRKTND